ncbi:MAG: dihydrodipicolinate synthase family protein [Verrucomicrobiales bacterium]
MVHTGEFPTAPAWVRQSLHRGLVIPAHPLALNKRRQYDPRRQRALTRYYHAAGAGGLAVGVHTTQFGIRQHGLLEPVLSLARETAEACDTATGRSTVMIAGVCGTTPQAVREASLARELGYHAGLLSFAGMNDEVDAELLAHARAVAREIPLFGFYLQPAVGGRLLSQNFWERFLEIPNIVGIKVAAFNRYQTLDVMRALVLSGRTKEVALYTGNDDHIVLDLLSTTEGGTGAVGFAGGLLGHWACWTSRAVALLEECRQLRAGGVVPAAWLTRALQVTDMNAAVFDAANGFAGCIPGVHEVLRRQGLLEDIRCLDKTETLSPGQAAEIDRVCREYPDLTDDAFVREHLDEWIGS